MKMLNFRNFVIALAVVLFFSIATQSQNKTSSDTLRSISDPNIIKILEPSYAIWPFYTKLLFKPYEIVPGPLQITILFSPNLECNSATLRVTEIERLEISGETEWRVSSTTKDTLSFVLSVNIPNNDTTGFRVEAEGCGKKQHSYYYFIAEEGKVRVTTENLSRAVRDEAKRIRSARNTSRRLYFERPGGESVPLTRMGTLFH